MATAAKIALTDVTKPPKRTVEVVQQAPEGYLTKPLVVETEITPPRNLRPVTDSHRFPPGYCTTYVASKRYVPWGGDAKYWLANAKAYGYETGREPEVGAIMVTSESSKGHVAYVEEVNDNTVTVSEMNYKGKFITSTRQVAISSRAIRGYIY